MYHYVYHHFLFVIFSFVLYALPSLVIYYFTSLIQNEKNKLFLNNSTHNRAMNITSVENITKT